MNGFRAYCCPRVVHKRFNKTVQKLSASCQSGFHGISERGPEALASFPSLISTPANVQTVFMRKAFHFFGPLHILAYASYHKLHSAQPTLQYRLIRGLETDRSGAWH